MPALTPEQLWGQEAQEPQPAPAQSTADTPKFTPDQIWGQQEQQPATQPAALTPDQIWGSTADQAATRLQEQQQEPQRRFEDLINDNDLLNSVLNVAQRYDPEAAAQFRNKQDVVNWYIDDRRWKDNNDISLAKEAAHVAMLDRNNPEDLATLRSIGYMRKVWDQLPAFWQKGGQGWGALAGDIARSLPSVGTAAGLVTGGLAKGLGKAGMMATEAATNAALSAAMNTGNQYVETQAGNQDSIDPKQVLAAAGTGAALGLPAGAFNAAARGATASEQAGKLIQQAAAEAKSASPEDIATALQRGSVAAKAAPSPANKTAFGESQIAMGEDEATTRPTAIEDQVLNDPSVSDDAKQLIADVREDQSNRYMNFKRQAIPNAQVLAQAAQDVAADPAGEIAKLLSIKPGASVNVEMQAKAFMLRKQVAKQIGDIADGLNTAADPGDVARLQLALAEKVDQFSEIDMRTDAIASEAGRTLQLSRVSDLNSVEGRLRALRQAVNKLGGEDNFQLAMRTVGDLATDPNSDRLAYFIQRLNRPTTFDKLNEFRYNAMLTGFGTHLALFKGNLAAQLIHTFIETPTAAGIGAVRSAFTGSSDRVYLAETGARISGLIGSFVDGMTGFKNSTFMDAFRPGGVARSTATDMLNHQPAIENPILGPVVRAPTTAITGVENAFKAWDRHATTLAYATRMAIQDGADLSDLTPYIERVERDPQLEEQIAEHARYMAYQGAPNGLAKALIDLRNKYPEVMTWFLPFIRTPANIIDYGLEYTPVGLLYGRGRAAMLAGGADRDLALAKLSMGAATMAYFGYKASQGYITGGPALDIKEAERRKLLNIPDYSIKIGDQWVPYDRWDPYNTVLETAADSGRLYSELNQGKDSPALLQFMHSLVHSMTDRSYLEGLKSIVDSLENPQRAGANLVNSTAGSFVPTLAAQYASATDPVRRVVANPLDAVMNRVPGLKETLPPKLDATGQPVEKQAEHSATARFLAAPFLSEGQTHDPVKIEMAKLGVGLAPMKSSFYGVQLDPDQHTLVAQAVGQTYYRLLAGQMQHANWGNMPEVAKQKAAQALHSAAQQIVLRHLVQTDPNFKRDFWTSTIHRLTEEHNPMSVQMGGLLQ